MTVSSVLALSFVSASTKITCMMHYLENGFAGSGIVTGIKTDASITQFNDNSVNWFQYFPDLDKLMIDIWG